MKSICLSLLAIITVVSFYSCANGDLTGKTQVIHDSLITVFPTWQSVQIKIGDNNTSLSVVIGDATFYKAPDDIKRAKAEELGKMILRICGSNNYLETGSLIVTADINNTSENPADGIKIPVDFPGLKKAAK